MSEVKYEDEKKLLTSDEFIAAAKQNADKNLQIQKDTAQKVYDSTYASLDRQYNEAAAAAGVAKQRNLIDADTAYQRQEMKYGAEQEALAAAGLSGSGMNEYRRAQSYQKNREDRQMSYAEYDRALREANYTRDQGKLAADLNKVQSDAAAEMHYNDTMTGIAEKELGYAELERQEIDAAYSGYLAGIEDGSLTLDQIKADSSWEKLSTEQQASVEKTAKIKGIKTKIDNGDKWENVQNSYAYLELDEDGRNQIDAYRAEVEAGKTKDANAASGNYLEMAMKGMSIDSIVALAKANGHYQTLVDSGFWNAVTAEAERIANEQSKSNVEGQTAINDENFANWVSALRTGGATLADIQALSGYANLTAAQKSQLESAATAYTDKQNAAKVEGQTAINDENFANWVSALRTGGATLADIQALSGYANLTAAQKSQLESAATEYADKQTAQQNDANYNTALGLLADGWTLDEIKNHLGADAVKALTDSGKFAQIENASDVIGRLEGKEAQESLLTYIDLAATGNYTLDQLVAIATSLGHYDTLSKLDKDGNETGLWAQVVSKFEQTARDNKNTETVTNINNAIANGATLEDIQKMPGYAELDDNVKEEIGEQVTARDEEKEITVDSVVANLFVPGNEVYSLDDLDTRMRAEGVPSEMREEIISRWQSENTDRALAGIEDGRFFENTDPVTFAENIKNGVYGNDGQRVATEYAKVLEASIQEDDVDIVDYALASYSFDQIKQYLPAAIKNRWETAKGNRLKIDSSFAMSNDSKIGGNPVKAGDRITDETTVAALNQYKTNSNSQLITVGKNTYYRDGDSWSLVVDDMSRPITLTAYHLSNDVTGTGSVKTQGVGYTIDGKRVAFAQIDQASKNALKNKYPNPSGMTYVKVGERYYVYMGNDWKYAYTKE